MSTRTPTVALIAAVARNGVIGDRGALPWRLATDMRRFRALTMGKPVIMGRKTWESLGAPLAGRSNIVITRQSGYRAEGARLVPDLDAALAAARREAASLGADEIMVIGGGEVYAGAIDLADRLYITEVDASPPGDAHFPVINDRWTPVSRTMVPAGDKDSAASVFTVYDRLIPTTATNG